MRSAWALPDAGATGRLGAALGRHCPCGPQGPRCLFLSGELGTGKTTLAAALLRVLGVCEVVNSPSYALVEVYPFPRGVAVHVDLYRLGSPDELEQLGLRDYLRADTLLVIEWPERVQAALPRPDLQLQLEVAAPGRLCRIEALTPFGEAWLALVERDMSAAPPDAGDPPQTP
ncbi:MAG TPA: tRNA (adenosine(37)-N6)-threonylcarbamoyltransferase complex ATPase subunit type 1 TsaE [Steroidobacteraceae bacterium]|nr:tRNA (adenosine(37)-N6)-threonylcarbamoyltransferase complex ATPase subunit type 1 TsaE [Steroidobacteraceae bacterium]